MADGQARSHILSDGPEAFAHPLADRSKGLEASTSNGGMNADAARRAMVNRDEDGNLATCARNGPRHIRAPHLIDVVRDDRAVMGTGAMGGPMAWLRTKPVLPHEPEHPRLRGSNALAAQTCPDLAVALAMEPAVSDHLFDPLDQISGRHRSPRTRAAARRGFRPKRAQVTIHACAAQSPDPAHPGNAVGVNGGVKSGHWGGAKVGQFVECALGRVATNQQARSKAHWPSGRLFSCQVEGLAIRARL